MKPYEPDKLPLEGLNYQQLFPFVGAANAELARYDGLLQAMVNPSVMLSPLTNAEAVLSSKIEGTQATVDEVLEQEAAGVPLLSASPGFWILSKRGGFHDPFCVS